MWMTQCIGDLEMSDRKSLWRWWSCNHSNCITFECAMFQGRLHGYSKSGRQKLTICLISSTSLLNITNLTHMQTENTLQIKYKLQIEYKLQIASLNCNYSDCCHAVFMKLWLMFSRNFRCFSWMMMLQLLV